jgi:hypothetical protein
MCCCGHGKYAPTILYSEPNGTVYDFLTPEWMVIGSNKRFYKKDSEGYFFVPQLEEAMKRFEKD